MVDFFGRDRHPEDIYRMHIRDYEDFLRKKEFSDLTVKLYISTARVFFQWMQDHDIIEHRSNPFSPCDRRLRA